MHTLDVSCNALSEDAARTLQEAMANNATLTCMDLRLNGVSPDTLAAINDQCKANRHRHENHARKAGG